VIGSVHCGSDETCIRTPPCLPCLHSGSPRGFDFGMLRSVSLPFEAVNIGDALPWSPMWGVADLESLLGFLLGMSGGTIVAGEPPRGSNELCYPVQDVQRHVWDAKWKKAMCFCACFSYSALFRDRLISMPDFYPCGSTFGGLANSVRLPEPFLMPLWEIPWSFFELSWVASGRHSFPVSCRPWTSVGLSWGGPRGGFGKLSE